MNKPRAPIEDSSASDSQHGAGSGFFSSRHRLVLRRLAAASLLVMLLIFWWFAVYVGLIAGWWLFNGYLFLEEEQNPYVWMGTVDWILMVLALLSLWPAQRWLRVQIAHFMEESPDAPHKIISQFSQEMDGVQTMDEQMSSLVHLLARTLNMPYVRIETADDGAPVTYGALPDRPSSISMITLPLSYNQVALGSLHLTPRLIGGVPVHVDEQLLQDLARQISLTLYTMRLSADLQASRLRIVTAREEARRQLRRDLHDGLGPSLAAMTMQADTARELVYDEPEVAEQLLANLVDQTQAMVDDIRRLVHGLRPPALDDVGLYGALELLVNGFTSASLQTEIRLPSTHPRLSAATEVAIYRIVQEGLTNVSKHAQAGRATVTVRIENTVTENADLVLSICDNGVGLPNQPEAGVGLNSMRERAEELGGRLAVQANAPSGSCVIARFPIDPGASDGSNSSPDLR